jgi:ABC-2 type transport system permease protein
VTRQIVSEWRKMISNPTMLWLLIGVILLTPGLVVGGFVVADLSGFSLDTTDGLREGFHALGATSMLAEVAAIIGMAGEFRFGQADQTFLSWPKRSSVVTTKIIVYTLLGTVFGIISAALALLTGWTWLAIKDSHLPFDDSLIWLIFGGVIVSATLFAAFGVAVGAVFRNQVVAIVVVLGLQTVIETSIFQANNSFGRWLPGLAGNAIRRFPDTGMLSPTNGVIVLAVWVAALLGYGYMRTVRKDIT